MFLGGTGPWMFLQTGFSVVANIAATMFQILGGGNSMFR